MKSGVYIISFGNRNYVGSSIDLDRRKYEHLYRLKNKTQSNIILQRCFDKYGIEKFNFNIVAICPPEYCIKLEQWFIDNTPNLMNHCLIAGSCLGTKRTEEFKQKIIKRNKERIITDEFRNKISNFHKGKIRTDIDKSKQSKTRKKMRIGFKFTEKEYKEMKNLHRTIPVKNILEKFNISKSQFHRIIKNNNGL